MEITTTGQTLVHLGIGLAYAIVTLVVAVATLWGLDHILYRQIDFIAEIKKGNVAAALFYSVLLIFVALLVSTAIN